MIAFALTRMPQAGFNTSGDAAYTSLVAQILPHGLRGMVACSMIVALMASLASKFNASATLVTMDFFREWYPNASGRAEVLTGRIATEIGRASCRERSRQSAGGGGRNTKRSLAR